MNLLSKILPLKYIFVYAVLFYPGFSYSQNAEQILKDAITRISYTSIEYSFNEQYCNSVFNETDTVNRRGFVYLEVNGNNLRFGLNYLIHVISNENRKDVFFKEHLFLNDTMFNFYSDVSIFNYINKNSRAYNYYVKDKERYTKISPMLIKYFYMDLLDDEKQKKWNLKINFNRNSDTIISEFECYQIEILTENGYLIGHNIFDSEDKVRSNNCIFLRKEDLVPIKAVFKSYITKSYTSDEIEILQMNFSNISLNSKANFGESSEFIKSKAAGLIEYRIYLVETYGLNYKELKVF